MAGLGSVIKFLESYRGRDKVLRLTSYVACFSGGVLANRNPNVSKKFFTIMKELNACRCVLRLFDDASMLGVCWKYGLGKQEGDLVNRLLQLLKNIANQAFFPIEHIAWAAEKELISLPAGPWWFGCLLAWMSSLIISIIKALWMLAGLRSVEKKSSEQTAEGKRKMKALRKDEYLTILESASNLGMAIHWLPVQRLWAGKLSQTTVGVLGLTSTLVGMSRMTI